MAFSCATRALWWVAACALAAHGKEPVELKVQKSMIIYFCSLADIPELVGNVEQCSTMKKEGEVLRFHKNNITRVEYRATGDEVIDLEPGTLDQLVDLRALRLDRVKTEKMPQNLYELALIKTGVTEMPPEVINVEELMIDEDYLKEINVAAPKLRKLTLRAPALRTLTLSQVNIEALRPAFAVHGELLNLTQTTLVRAKGQLPNDFLRGAIELNNFTVTHSNLTTLPLDLSAFKTKMKHLNFNNNRIRYISYWTFLGFDKLETLWMADNELGLNDLQWMYQLVTLKHLDLSNNPLGDLCIDGKSPFHSMNQLERLDLVNTDGAYLCYDWMNLTKLSILNYQNNTVWSLNCDHLIFRRDESVKTPTLDLTGNDIRRFICGQAEYSEAYLNQYGSKKEVTIIISVPARCSCGWYWFERTRRLRRVDLVRPSPQQPCSAEKLAGYKDC